MKILYTCTYSRGPSGVWNRVYQLAQQMIKRGHEVHVISSERVAGNKSERAAEYDIVNGIHLHRFPVISFGSDNAFLYRPWQLKKCLKEIMPDVVDCQTYRHHEGHVILKECKKLGIRCVLTTHSPFARKRGRLLSLFVKLYDRFIGRYDLKKFDAVVYILKSEESYLNNLVTTGKEGDR